MNLSATGTIVMVVIIAIAVVAMVAVIARGNRKGATMHSEPAREERLTARSPGLDPDAAQRHARMAGDDTHASVEPGGHVIRDPQR